MITPRERFGISIVITAVFYAGIFFALGKVSWGTDPFEDQIGPVFVDLQPDTELDAYLKAERPTPEPEAPAEEPPKPQGLFKAIADAVKPAEKDIAPVRDTKAPVFEQPAQNPAVNIDKTSGEVRQYSAPDNTFYDNSASNTQTDIDAANAAALAAWMDSVAQEQQTYAADQAGRANYAGPAGTSPPADLPSPKSSSSSMSNNPIPAPPLQQPGVEEKERSPAVPDTAGKNAAVLPQRSDTGTSAAASAAAETGRVTADVPAAAAAAGTQPGTGNVPVGTAGDGKAAAAAEEKPKSPFAQAIENLSKALSGGKSGGSGDTPTDNASANTGTNTPGTFITQGPFTISGIDRGGRSIQAYAEPVVPAHIKNSAQTEYLVTAVFTVLPDGLVKPGIAVTKSSGDSRLDDAVRTAVSKWRFTPAPGADKRGVEVTVVYKLTKK